MCAIVHRKGKKDRLSGDSLPLLRTLLWLSIPTVIEEVLATLLQYVDTAMVGQLGEQATASVSITTNVTWLVNSIPGAIGTAILVLISKSEGAGQKEQVKKLAQQAFLLSLVFGLVLGGVSVLLSSRIPVWMGAALRAVQNTKTPMLINVAANGANILFNYLFIYVLGYGVEGAAVASAISYVLAGVFMFLSCRKNELLRWEWKHFAPDAGLLRQCAAIGTPVLGTSMVSCFGYVVFASLISGMGTTVFAAHSIAVTAETIFYVPGYGLRSAASTLISNARGEGNVQKLKTVAKVSIALTVAMMCMSGILLYLGARPLMGIFSPSQAVVNLGAQMLRLVALSEPFFGLMVVLEGVFYGLGRTRYAFVVESIGMWGVRIFFTFLVVRVWGMDLRAVWYCMIADNVCKAVLLAMPFLSRARRRILLEK